MQEPVSKGAVNDDPESIIHKHTNPALKTRTNKIWQGVVAALATGDKTNWDNAQAAFNQLFKISASGLYLDRRSANDGVVRPQGIGMSDDTFRKLSILLTNKRVTQEALLEILEIFYGVDALHAYAETSLIEPFVLNDQDDLQVLLDERDVAPITFLTGSFAQIGNAKAIEVAAAITAGLRAANNNGYALAFYDPTVNANRVRIYSPSRGLSSAIRITGGKAQNALQFPTPLSIYTGIGALPTWSVTFDAPTNTVTFTCTSATSIDLTQLQVGDYVNIYGAEFLAANRGSFTVTAVSVSYPSGTLTQSFSLINPNGIAQVLGGPQGAQADLLYFRPTKQTTQKAPTRAVVVSQGAGAARVLLPATTAAVGRAVDSGAYVQARSSATITAMTRLPSGLVTVTAPSHGFPLPTADLPTIQVYIDNARATVGKPSITAGNPGGSPATTDYAQATITSDLKATTQSGTFRHSAILLSTGDVLIAGGKNITGGVTTYRNKCELFSVVGSTNPVSGATQYQYNWLAANPLPAGQAWCMATALNDGSGKAMVAGGIDAGGVAAPFITTALYTPQVGGPGSWAGTGILNVGRSAGGIVSYGSGTANRVLIFGGCTSDTTSINSVELYNPQTGTWSVQAPMNALRTNPVGVVFNTNNDVMVCGGRQLGAGTHLDWAGGGDEGVPLNSAEVFHAGSWAKTGSMVYTRFAHNACVLPDGRVLVVGGLGYDPSKTTTIGYVTACEIWDPISGIWSPCGSIRNGREFPGVTYVASLNRVYVTGGTASGWSGVEYLDLATMKWHASLAAPSTQHKNSLATLLTYSGNPLILLSGGIKANGDTIDTNTLVIPTSEKVTSGRLNGLVTATVVDANTFTFTSGLTDFSAVASVGASVTWVSSVKNSIGPYIFDPVAGIAITGTETKLTQTLAAGHQYTSISVSSNGALAFPDAPGYLCLGFGTGGIVAKVPYLGRLSNSALLIDYSFVFPKDVPSGTKVTLMYQKGGWAPPVPQNAGCFYLTSSAAGRVAAIRALDDAASAGIALVKTVEYPSDIGLGNAGKPDSGNYKISDRVAVWGSDDLDSELAAARSS